MKRATHEVVTLLLALLATKPHTQRQLAETSATKTDIVGLWVNRLHDKGLVYISGHAERTNRGGRRACLWAWQPSLFFHPDVPYPRADS